MAILKYLGFGGSSSPTTTEKTAVRALPGNWYTSTAMYDLERRAIFARKWQLVTHKARFTEPGSWIKLDVANFSFFLVKDRDGKINGFHNVCRHRAFPVVQGESGCAKIFACKYHGWSYGINGKLAKAPGYQELDGFQKEKNGLMPIHVRIDRNGFIWVNLDLKTVPEVSWESDFLGIDEQPRYDQFNFDDYVFDHTWEMEGDYNWKILADNYNECYHCATTHPDIDAVANLQTYAVDTEGGNIIHDPKTTEEQRKAGLVICSTYYFPNVSTNISPNFFMIQRFVPTSASKSSMQYQVFRNKHASTEDFDRVNQIYHRVMSEDKALCAAAQKNINAGVFINGEMHPRLEKGPLYFQHKVRENVTAHHKREQAAGGRQLWATSQQLPASATVSHQDVEFCEGLGSSQCIATAPEGLAW